MSKSDRFALLVFGTLLSIACVADDEKAPADEADSLAAESSALGELLQQPAYSERWQLNPDLEPAADSTEQKQALDDIEFQEASGIVRLTQQRSLSLLTLSRPGQARLFFGVNEKGTVGFHYRAESNKSEEGYQAFGRLPQRDALREDESATE